MAKDTFYFQHDYNSRNDDKILELRARFGAEGYGIWWMLLESIAETEDGHLNNTRMAGLSLGYGVPVDKLKEVIDFCLDIELLKLDGDLLYNQRMLEHKEIRREAKEKGKAAAKKRWGGEKNDATPNGYPNGVGIGTPLGTPLQDPMGTPIQRKGKESKEKERKEKENINNDSPENFFLKSKWGHKLPLTNNLEPIPINNDHLEKLYKYREWPTELREAFDILEPIWVTKRFNDMNHFNNWFIKACSESKMITKIIKLVE